MIAKCVYLSINQKQLNVLMAKKDKEWSYQSTIFMTVTIQKF